METRKVKVVRTLTLVKNVVMEIPATVTNDELEDALNDEGKLSAMLDKFSLYDMNQDTDTVDVYDYDPKHGSVATEFPFFGELEVALKDDGLI